MRHRLATSPNTGPLALTSFGHAVEGTLLCSNIVNMEARSRGGKEMEADGSFGDRLFICKLWYNKDVRQSARILSRALHYAAPSPHTQNGPKGAIPEAQRETVR